MLSRKHEFIILIGIITIAFLLRLYRLTYPLADWHSFRQADTASVAREYVKHGIDLLRPRYHDLSNIQSGRPNPQGYRMVEFPLVSGLVALSYPLISSILNWPLHVLYRLTSVIFSLISLVILYLLTKQLFSRSLALLTAVTFAFLPYNIYYSRTILPEVPLVTMSLLALYAGVKALHSRSLIWFAVLTVSGAIALLLKPTAAFFLVPLCVPALQAVLKHPRHWLYWSVSAVIILFPFFLWRRWIIHFPEGIPAATWLLNGNGIRLRPAWFRWLFYERLTKLMLGYVGIILFASGLWSIIMRLVPWPRFTQRSLSGWLSKPEPFAAAFLLFWLGGAVAYLVTFASGNVQHDYYQVPLVPLVSLLVALGLDFLWQGRSVVSRSLVLAACGLSLFLSWQQVRGYFNVNNWAMVRAGEAVDRLTPPNALVIAPYLGDTAFLYQTNRRGWPLGYDIDQKIAQGAQYYVTVTFDDEARELAQRYSVIEKDPEYLLVQLTPRTTLTTP